MATNSLIIFPILIHLLIFSPQISAIDFIYNGFSDFNSSSNSSLLLYSYATIESRVLSLTNQTSFAIGRALYPTKIPTKPPNSTLVYPFSTSFIFSIAPYKNVLPGHGFVFLFVPFTGIQGSTASQNLGLFNRTNDGNPTNHVFGVEFDVFQNQEFNDVSDNHVGIDLNSLTSTFAEDAGFWPENSNSGDPNAGAGNSFVKLKLNSGRNYQVWIDYRDSVINVTLAPVGVKRPTRPLINVPLNLSGVLEDEMYVGFTASTGRLVESHKILAWSFSNSNFSLSESLITTGLPSFVIPEASFVKSKGFIAGITVGVLFVVVLVGLFSMFFVRRKQRIAREKADMEEWELEYWPHRMLYTEIESATRGFSEQNVIGIGGNGKVYKGVLPGGAEVAVKRISHENDGMREFLAEIATLGRLKHRSLVGLRGWCKQEKGIFMLVYDYMENGSLDHKVYDCDLNEMLSCEERIRILKDVASGVLYLHEGWERKVLHRDIKASNVLLDKEMNGRLGDFGLARIHSHGQVATTTRVVGTVGYMAPEVVRTGRASAQTDVFGFGVLILEVMCGRRPIEGGKEGLLELVLRSMVEGNLISVFDERLKIRGGFDEEEVERVIHLGLLCTFPDPNSRPNMRQVVKILEGKSEANESDYQSEDLDAYLMEHIKSRDLWLNYSQQLSYSSHPTFELFKQTQTTQTQSSSSNVSLSWTNSGLVEDSRRVAASGEIVWFNTM
ncbi:Concanavalin A-like lectin protein kinase family protein [Euphorbia peplus]|nr:Concanavalin A-like lectin protein kinase family protein [Euphorbia peplus]